MQYVSAQNSVFYQHMRPKSGLKFPRPLHILLSFSENKNATSNQTYGQKQTLNARLSGAGSSLALATRETSQVLLASVPDVFSRGCPHLLIGPSHMS